MIPARGPQTVFFLYNPCAIYAMQSLLCNLCYAIDAMQSMYNKSPLMQSMLCNLCYAIYAMQSAIYAMQSMLCNLCYAIYAKRNMLKNIFGNIGHFEKKTISCSRRNLYVQEGDTTRAKNISILPNVDKLP